MSKHKIYIIFAMMTFLSACSESPKAENASRPIQTVKVELSDIEETIQQTGEIQPRFNTAMSFRINGHLLYRAETGAIVHAGDVVAKLDHRVSENGVLKAKAELETAKAELKLAQLNAERIQNLFDKNVASESQLQQTDAAFKTAQAKINLAEAALADAEDILSYTELKADRDGVISAVGANEGEVVNAGQMVVNLVSDQERDAVFNVPEKLLSLDIKSQKVKAVLISDPSIVSYGNIREITPLANSATRTFRIKISLDEKSRDMPLGAAVTGFLKLQPKKLVVLPASAISQKNGEPSVFVADPQMGRVTLRAVKIERYTNTTVLISAGLLDGEVIVAAGVNKLRDGEKVAIEEKSKNETANTLH